MKSLFLSYAVCLVLAVGTRAADPQFVKLVNSSNGKVLAIEDQSDEIEAKAVLAKDDSADKCQHWIVEQDGSHIKLINRKSGKVLDVYGNSSDEGTPIIQWDDKDEGFDNQRWIWVGSDKARRLKSKLSGLVLDADSEGYLIQNPSDEGSKSQLWEVVAVK